MRDVRFGLCGLDGRAGPDGDSGAALRNLVDYAALAEAEGLDGAWVSEHHFSADGYLPAPWVALGAVAQATERITIGTDVLLAPLHDPLRTAEDAAVVDQLSGGRLVVGLGLGYRSDELQAFGVRSETRVPRLLAMVDILRRAWRGEPVGGVALLGADEAVPVRPLPAQDPGPRIWIGSSVEAGVRRARQIGDGFIAPPGGVRGFGRQVDWLGDDLDGFAVMTTIYVFVGARDPWAAVAPGISQVEDSYRRWLHANEHLANMRGVPAVATLDAPPHHYIVGTPDEVYEALLPWYRALRRLPGNGPAHLGVRLTWPGVSANEESIRLFAREVAPRLLASADDD